MFCQCVSECLQNVVNSTDDPKCFCVLFLKIFFYNVLPVERKSDQSYFPMFMNYFLCLANLDLHEFRPLL